MNLRNEYEFSYNFELTSKVFYKWDEACDYAVLKLPKSKFNIERIPISYTVTQTLKTHAFGYIGHTRRFTITDAEVTSIIPEQFTINLLSAPGYSGAAIVVDYCGRAIGYMGGNLDASEDPNSQHQSYCFKFDQVVLATKRPSSPTIFPD